jgi:hypothetical protein
MSDLKTRRLSMSSKRRHMRSKTAIDSLFFLFLVTVVFHQGCRNTGSEPVGPLSDSWFEGWDTAGNKKPEPVTFRLSASEVPAAENEYVTVEVLIADTVNDKPVSGRRVIFKVTSGTITYSDTTDINGVARAVLNPSPVNGTAVVTASWGDPEFADTCHVRYSGSTVAVYSQDTACEVPSFCRISVTVKNGEREPVSGETVVLEGMIDTSVETGIDGKAYLEISRSAPGTGKIIARALNDSCSISFTFMQPNGVYNSGYCPECAMVLSVAPQTVSDETTDSAAVAAVVIDRTGQPVANSLVGFTAEGGVITCFSYTNQYGVAHAVYHAGDIAGEAIITAFLAGYKSVADTASLTITRNLNDANFK